MPYSTALHPSPLPLITSQPFLYSMQALIALRLELHGRIQLHAMQYSITSLVST